MPRLIGVYKPRIGVQAVAAIVIYPGGFFRIFTEESGRYAVGEESYFTGVGENVELYIRGELVGTYETLEVYESTTKPPILIFKEEITE